MRYILLDKITEMERSKRATGIKTISMSEDFLTHHFPLFPVMPGMLIIEAMAQLASWLIAATTDFHQKALLASVESAKFRHFVRPGNTLDLEVKVSKMEEAKAFFRGTAKVDTKTAASASFSMRLVPLETLEDTEEARFLFQNTLFAVRNTL